MKAIVFDQILQCNYLCSGFDHGEFENLFASNEQCASLIKDKRLSAVKFTGSTKGGAQVAELCGRNLKKMTLELGGNDPFCVLADADIQKAVECAYKSRMGTNG